MKETSKETKAQTNAQTEVKIRENTTIKLSPWNGKTKKNFVALFKENGIHMTREQVFDSIIKPYIEPNDIYLSKDEYEYLLIRLKMISFDNDISFKMKCSSCMEEMQIETNLDEVTNYIPGSLSGFTLEDKTEFKDIALRATYEKAKKKYNETDEYLAMVMSVKLLKGEYPDSIDDVIKYFDEMPLLEYDTMERDYLERLSYLDLGLNITCPHCGVNEDYDFDSLPGFFEDILPASITQ